MFDSNYSWFAEIGFWFGLGVIQAIAVSFALIYFVGKLVNWAYGLFSYVNPVKQYTFTDLPEFYDSIKLSYDKKTKVLTATAQYRHNQNTVTVTKHLAVKPRHTLKEVAVELQLSLTQFIASSTK